jgi:hypothetical protein
MWPGNTFLVIPRVAALIETTMLALFAFLVLGPNTWFASTPKLAGTPAGARFPFDRVSHHLGHWRLSVADRE